jgi:glycosyltransferase involved in cell wall biosynthesis
MSYHANATAAVHAVRRIMPEVWKRRPEARLQIVGQDPPRTVRRLEGPSHGRVKVSGFVPDIRPYLRRATLALAPLTYGAGVQNKVLEAMACATPVIATSRAVSALEIEPGRDLVVADDPVSFAEAIDTLLSKPDLMGRVAACGRSYVVRNHSWEESAIRLETIYSSARGREPGA